MNKEDLKLLAEWVGYYAEPVKNGRKIEWYAIYKDPKPKNNRAYVRKLINWQPDKDSNQLDILENKMMEELQLKYDEIAILITIHGNNYVCDIGYNDSTATFISLAFATGSTKNKARLNAILNYIRRTNEN